MLPHSAGNATTDLLGVVVNAFFPKTSVPSLATQPTSRRASTSLLRSFGHGLWVLFSRSSNVRIQRPCAFPFHARI